MVERFQIFVFLVMITLQNFSDLDWNFSTYWVFLLSFLDLSARYIYQWNVVLMVLYSFVSQVTHMIQAILTVWLSECLVDWIKHAFITKFNQMPPDIYPQVSNQPMKFDVFHSTLMINYDRFVINYFYDQLVF